MRLPTFCLMLFLGLLVAAHHPAKGHEYAPDVDDEAFWTADTLLTQRVDSLGHEAVVREVEQTLIGALEVYPDTSVLIDQDTLDEWVEAIRWATILKDDELLSHLEAITRLGRHPRQVDVYYRLTYIARWGLYRVNTEGATVADKITMLMNDFFSEDEFARIFAQDRILDLGSEALPPLIDYARSNIVPRMDELDKELTSAEDLRFVTDYLYFTDFLRALIKTDDDRALFEGLLKDPDSHVQTLARDVLEGLEEDDEE